MHPELVAIVAVAGAFAVALGGIALKGFSMWVNRSAVGEGEGMDLRRIEDLEGRVAELEERVDFSERLLTERRHGTLPPPSSQ